MVLQEATPPPPPHKHTHTHLHTRTTRWYLQHTEGGNALRQLLQIAYLCLPSVEGFAVSQHSRKSTEEIPGDRSAHHEWWEGAPGRRNRRSSVKALKNDLQADNPVHVSVQTVTVQMHCSQSSASSNTFQHGWCGGGSAILWGGRTDLHLWPEEPKSLDQILEQSIRFSRLLLMGKRESRRHRMDFPLWFWFSVN